MIVIVVHLIIIFTVIRDVCLFLDVNESRFCFVIFRGAALFLRSTAARHVPPSSLFCLWPVRSLELNFLVAVSAHSFYWSENSRSLFN